MPSLQKNLGCSADFMVYTVGTTSGRFVQKSMVDQVLLELGASVHDQRPCEGGCGRGFGSCCGGLMDVAPQYV